MAAAVSATSLRLSSSKPIPISTTQVNGRTSGLRFMSVGWKRGTLKASRLLTCYAVAKPETIEKVCGIVRKQLALPSETEISGESKFTTLGADSLDTVEIVMGLEEEFGITVEEDSSQNITTIQDAADLIERLVQQNAGA
ncbi:hypothetical protein Dimus_023659 [Dionaea muscipula]